MDYAEARAEMSELLANPFWQYQKDAMWRTGDYMPRQPRQRRWVAAGAQAAWLRAAALRELIQGEG
jgi:hypothetical protein